MFNEVSKGGGSLIYINLDSIYMSEVPADLVASALTRLEEVCLRKTMLTYAQAAALMEAINRDDATIKELSLSGSLPSFSFVMDTPRYLNLQPLVKLEMVDLYDNFFTKKELIDLFEALSEFTNLKRLHINQWPWQKWESKMDAQSTKVMARAINFLEEVELTGVLPYQADIVTHTHIETLWFKTKGLY